MKNYIIQPNGQLGRQTEFRLVPLPTFRYYDSTLQTCQSILLWSTTDKWIPRLPQFYICMHIYIFQSQSHSSLGTNFISFSFFQCFFTYGKGEKSAFLWCRISWICVACSRVPVALQHHFLLCLSNPQSCHCTRPSVSWCSFFVKKQ